MELKLDINKVYAIALEGGGAKGAYEIGAWKALDEAGIKYKAVAGTSVGALNGAMMAMRDLKGAIDAWWNIRLSDIVDVNEGNWWHEAVDYVVSKGYMNGMDATHFGPSRTMNRAQFVTVLYRMEGEPSVTNTGIFTDVADDLFYTNAAYWALEAGITTGATANTFKPGGKLTRTELVTFMYRYAAYKGYDTTAATDLSAYHDAGKVLGFAVEPWKWAVSHGIVSGMTADTLAPMNLTNRAQAATIFQRFDSKFAG